MNILITSASRKVSLVKAFQKALALEGGGKVIAVDISPLSPALYLADKHFLLPPSNKVEFLGELLRLCRELKVKLIIPTRDEELAFFAEHKNELASHNIFVAVSSPETVKICQDKNLFCSFCQKNNFKLPKSYSLSDRGLQFPLFVRPRYGKGSINVKRVNSKEELVSAIKDVPDAIIQELIEAKEYTIDLFSDFSGEVISVVPRERCCVIAGESYVSKTSKNPLLINEAIRLANKLKLLAHNTIQCFLDKNEVKFIEVNPRFGGAANLGFSAGAFTPRYLVKLAKNETLNPVIGEFKNNYIMLRYTEDFFIDGRILLKQKQDEGRYI